MTQKEKVLLSIGVKPLGSSLNITNKKIKLDSVGIFGQGNVEIPIKNLINVSFNAGIPFVIVPSMVIQYEDKSGASKRMKLYSLGSFTRQATDGSMSGMKEAYNLINRLITERK